MTEEPPRKESKSLHELLDEAAADAEAGEADQTDRPLPAHVKVSRPNRHRPTDDEYAEMAADYAANPITADEIRVPIELRSYGKPTTEPRTRPPYEVNVTRDDKWWMITVPELAGHVTADGATNYSDTTQAREPAEIASQARDFICTVTGVSPSEVDLHIVIPHPPD